MKKCFCILFVCCTLFYALQAKENNSFLVKVTAREKAQIVEGDSAIFSVWLYSTYPMGDIQCDNPTIKINHCHVRLAQEGNPRNQKITIVNNKKYYCLLWGQYIVGGSRRGSYTFPSMTFSINQYIEQEDSLDPFDPFGFFRQPTYKKIPCKATSDGLKFTIIPEPQKTTQELLQSGKTVI